MGRFSISIVLQDANSGWKWILSNTYGPHESVEREEMWGELSAVREAWEAPWCVLGDFNVTRYPEDRNRVSYMTPDMQRFSEWIAQEGLLDIPISNLMFTWSNMRDSPSMAKLDRFLVCPDWEDVLPGSSAIGLARPTSDHVPILLRSLDRPAHATSFKFESWWTKYRDLEEVVRNSWSASAFGYSGAKRLAFKLQRLKRVLKVWGRHKK
ncbi:hypothetical protein QJS10_CPA16g00524 [Acorus calamus]|uniref:Endonuclease/exonuclease/phosphatase domain-containing protein n=1 Tax=Acorus calamus TaxID=4465 RepID=A0AAV9CZV2_ACOCL|nr:hypothetical protein QJS10_CPA16g00524 [Acorus calamus]